MPSGCSTGKPEGAAAARLYAGLRQRDEQGREMTDFPTLIGVVIPVRNEAHYLPSQLEALASQTYRGRWEVVIADNGSTDGSAAVAKRCADRLPALRVVDASRRRGINHARNVGSAAARGDLILFCDADDVASPQWLEAMAEAARHADIVGGLTDGDTLNNPVSVAWRFSYPKDDLPRSLGFLRYAGGGNLAIRAEVLRDLGGWNEDYAGGCDEVELCWRAQLAGYRMGFAPRAVMHCRYRSGLREFARQMYGYGFGETKLYRDFRDRGLRRPSIRRRLRQWRWLLTHAPDLFRSVESRGIWIRWAAYWFGRLRGSIHHRVIFL